MAQIIINIPNAVLPRVINSVADYYGYEPRIPDPVDRRAMIDNPETKPQFARRMIRRWLREIVAQQEGASAAETARRTARNQAESDIDIGVS